MALTAGAKLSRSQLARLGDSLRAVNPPRAEDLVALASWRDDHQEALRRAKELIVGAGLGSPTERLKNTYTIIEKLRREATLPLYAIRDIAGLRLVKDMTLDEQDAIVAQLKTMLTVTKIVDRCAKPNNGYRAKHTIVRKDGYLIEIQVRTVLQDEWAQLFERLGDQWGRGIRYALPPEQPDALVPPGVTRREYVDSIKAFSQDIGNLERLLNDEARLTRKKGLWGLWARIRRALMSLGKSHRRLLRAKEQMISRLKDLRVGLQ